MQELRADVLEAFHGIVHVEIARLLIEQGAVVDDSVLRDHNIEMVGS